jgi:hypothetical protein
MLKSWAQKHWRRLQGFELIPKVVVGVQFVDGEEQTQQAANQSFNRDAPLSDTQHLTISRKAMGKYAGRTTSE